MIWLILGVLLWAGAHLFKRLLPEWRAAMGKAGRGVVAVTVLAAIGLMIIGYRGAGYVYLYDLPPWVWHVNNLLMLISVFLLDAGRVKGVVAARLRHPMLTGVVMWAVAHLLVNGDLASLEHFPLIRDRSDGAHWRQGQGWGRWPYRWYGQDGSRRIWRQGARPPRAHWGFPSGRPPRRQTACAMYHIALPRLPCGWTGRSRNRTVTYERKVL